MAEQQQTHGQLPPGTVRPKGVRPRFHYELIGCGLRGHEIVGTDVAKVRPSDGLLVREPGDGLRWYRCVRCDAWVPLPLPAAPTRQYLPDRSDIALPLRGRPLRDRYVLRLIALDRLVAFFVVCVAMGRFPPLWGDDIVVGPGGVRAHRPDHRYEDHYIDH